MLEANSRHPSWGYQGKTEHRNDRVCLASHDQLSLQRVSTHTETNHMCSCHGVMFALMYCSFWGSVRFSGEVNSFCNLAFSGILFLGVHFGIGRYRFPRILMCMESTLAHGNLISNSRRPQCMLCRFPIGVQNLLGLPVKSTD